MFAIGEQSLLTILFRKRISLYGRRFAVALVARLFAKEFDSSDRRSQ
jgi:hypothetical protein